MIPVFTYNDSADAEHGKLVALWQKSWTDRGWEAKVLGMADAKRHPLYTALMERAAEVEDKTERAAVRSSYRKWLAFAVAGGGYLSDPEVVNYSFAPQGYPEGYLTFYARSIDPCLVSGNRDVVEGFLDHLRGTETVCTDVDALRKHQLPSFCDLQPTLWEFRKGDWSRSPLVRYSAEQVALFGFPPRSDCIKFVRQLP